MFQLRLKGVLSSFKGVSRIFGRSLKGVSGKFQCCLTKFQRSFKEVSRVFQDSFMGVSRKIEGLKGDFGRFQGYLKEV